jgi:hypothetical protein
VNPDEALQTLALREIAAATDKLSQLASIALVPVVVQIAHDQGIPFDVAAVRALDAYHELREAQKTWAPPPGYRAHDLPRDYVQQLIGHVQELAETDDCDIAACSLSDPRCYGMSARALLDRLGIPWQSDDAGE